jgi:hypothetical protein
MKFLDAADCGLESPTADGSAVRFRVSDGRRRHQVKANAIWARTIEEERGGRFHNAFAQLLPSVTFGKDVFGQALGAIAAIGLLSYFEHQVCHFLMIWQLLPRERSSFPLS